MQIHASCAARHGWGVLLIGAPGSGKSDLVLRLLDHGFSLVADDRVEIEDGQARPPDNLAGLLEVRGLGILRLPYLAPVKLALAVTLAAGPRLPSPMRDQQLDLPVVGIDPAQPSAPTRVRMALECATGRMQQLAGGLRVSRQRVVMVSGLSGAGKASILRALEDIGYDAVDNPPLTLVETLVNRTDQPLAIGLDARSRGFDATTVRGLVERLRANPGLRTELVYAWADETALLRRFTETRRRHPLAPQGRVIDGIASEAALTRPLQDEADLVIDTSGLPLAELRQRIEQRFRPGMTEAGRLPGLVLSLVSFAFPAGLPREADMVFDARFLRNPHYDPILRPGTGKDAAVAAYVAADPDFDSFFGGIAGLLKLLVPRFVQEGKKYATIAVGCTGGRHRSVYIVERLAGLLRETSERDAGNFQVTITHRELARAAAKAEEPAHSGTQGEGSGTPS